MMNALDELKLKLMDCLLMEHGLQEIIDIAAEYLHNPVAIVDNTTWVYAWSHIDKLEGQSEDLLHNALINGYTPYPLVLKYNIPETVEMVAQAAKAFIIDTHYATENRRILKRIMIQGKMVAYVVVIEIESEFSQQDLEITDLLSMVLSVAMANLDSHGALRNKQKDILIDLMKGEIKGKAQIENVFANFNESTTYYVLTIAERTPGVDVNTRLFMMANYLEKQNPYMETLYHNDRILAIIGLENNAITQQMLDDLRRFMVENEFRAALSQKFHNITNLRHYYKQTEQLLAYGIERHPDESLYQYSRLYFSYLFLNAEKSIKLKDFCMQELLDLVQHDQNNETDFVKTLSIYLANGKNVKDSALALFIHRNTMRYRLERIEEVMGVSLSDPEVVLMLSFSLKLLEHLDCI